MTTYLLKEPTADEAIIENIRQFSEARDLLFGGENNFFEFVTLFEESLKPFNYALTKLGLQPLKESKE